jgi:tetratricopeptide (TPR) repeat protein
LLAGLRRGQGDLAGAEALFRRLVEVDPSFTSQNALAGFLAQDPTRDAEAEAAYREAIASAEADELARAYGALADFLAARQRSDEAAQLLTEGIAAVDDPVLIYKLGRLYHLQGNFEKATETIQRAADAQPDDPAPILALAQYRASIADYEGALQASDQAVELDPDSLPARVQKAEILVDSGIYGGDRSRIAEGRAIVEAVLLETPSAPPALYVRGRAEIAEDRLDEAVETLSLATSVAPDWAPPHAALGSILFARGDAAGALPELLRSAQLEPTNFAARGLLARTYATLGDWDLAIREARAIVDVVEEPGLRLVIVQSLARQGRLDEALQEFERLPEDARGAEAWYLAGRIRLREGDSQGARAAFLRSAEIAEQPRFELLKQLLRLDAQEGRVEESAARIRAAAEARPEDGKLAQLLGQVAYLQGDAETAEAELRRATELAPGDARGYEVLARFLAQTGRGDEVVATLEAALERSPDQASLHLALASLYKAQGRNREAMQRYEDAVRLDPSLVHAKNNLAYLIVEEGGDLGRALELAQQAKEGAPNDPRVADTLGWVLYKRDVPEAAVGYLREAEAGLDADDPALPVVRQHLALAYEASGDLPAARELVERALADLDAQRGQATAGEPASVADLRAVQERLSRER